MQFRDISLKFIAFIKKQILDLLHYASSEISLFLIQKHIRLRPNTFFRFDVYFSRRAYCYAAFASTRIDSSIKRLEHYAHHYFYGKWSLFTITYDYYESRRTFQKERALSLKFNPTSSRRIILHLAKTLHNRLKVLFIDGACILSDNYRYILIVIYRIHRRQSFIV